MNFELVRAGWPNTMAILALAILPLISLMTLPQQTEAAASATDATICPAPQDAPMTLALLTSAELK